MVGALSNGPPVTGNLIVATSRTRHNDGLEADAEVPALSENTPVNTSPKRGGSHSPSSTDTNQQFPSPAFATSDSLN